MNESNINSKKSIIQNIKNFKIYLNERFPLGKNSFFVLIFTLSGYIFTGLLYNSKIIKNIAKRNILSSSLPITFPFIFSNLNDKSGILSGLSRSNNSIVMLNRFNKNIYKNSNMCIFGSSGSRKIIFYKIKYSQRISIKYNTICHRSGK